VLQVWRDGGYSDDLLTAGYCAAQGLVIAVPATAIFPQQLQQQYSLRQYWNYLRRQLFVLDTYQVGGGVIIGGLGGRGGVVWGLGNEGCLGGAQGGGQGRGTTVGAGRSEQLVVLDKYQV
jgi:hypothetical protein